jgi:hypothetical protein
MVFQKKGSINKMKSLRILVFAILLVAVAATSQAQQYNTIIKTQAMDMAKALLKKDYTAFSKYMHPGVAEYAGGRNKLIQQLDSANAIATKFGAEIKRVLIGNPGEVVKHNKELQALLPQTTELKTGFGSLALETTLVAISQDGGKNWYFIDTSIFNVKELKKSLPNLSPQLVIPPAKSPKFTPNQ